MRSIASVAMLALLIGDCAYAHDSNPGNLAWQACEASSVNLACQYTIASRHRYIGTCQSINQQLMCVRNKPIEHLTPEETGDDSHGHHHHSSKQKQAKE